MPRRGAVSVICAALSCVAVAAPLGAHAATDLPPAEVRRAAEQAVGVAGAVPPAPGRISDYATAILDGTVYVFPDQDLHWSTDVSLDSPRWTTHSADSGQDDDDAVFDMEEGTQPLPDADEYDQEVGPLPGLRATPLPTTTRSRALATRVHGLGQVLAARAATSELFATIFICGGGSNADGEHPKYHPLKTAWWMRPIDAKTRHNSKTRNRLLPLPDMPTETAYPAVVVSDTNQKLFVLGGVNNEHVLADAYALSLVPLSDAGPEGSPVWGEWTALKSMNAERAGHAATILNNHIYAMGSIPPMRTSGYLASMEYYDLANPDAGWTTHPAVMPEGAAFFSALSFDCAVWRVGGVTGTTDVPVNLNKILRIDAKVPGAQWQNPVNLTDAISHAGTVQFGSSFFTIGGNSGKSSGIDTTQVLPMTPHLPCPVGKTGPNCAQCAKGYFGPNCSPCPGIDATCGDACYGHGTCDGSNTTGGTGVCTCSAKYQNPDYPDCSHCLKSLANPLGGCDQCDPNYFGPTCTPCAGTPVIGVACNGHGKCSGGGSKATSGNGSCTCDPAWASPSNKPADDQYCQLCAAGYFGDDCKPCPGVVAGIGPCYAHGTCDESKSGTGTCTCDADGDWTGTVCCEYAHCPFPGFTFLWMFIAVGLMLAAYLTLNVRARALMVVFIPALQIMSMYSTHPILRAADVGGNSVVATALRRSLQTVGLVLNIDFTNFGYFLWCEHASALYGFELLWVQPLLGVVLFMGLLGLTVSIHKTITDRRDEKAGSSLLHSDVSSDGTPRPPKPELTRERIYGGAAWYLMIMASPLLQKALESFSCTTEDSCSTNRQPNLCETDGSNDHSQLGVLALLIALVGVPVAICLTLRRPEEVSPTMAAWQRSQAKKDKKSKGKKRRRDRGGPPAERSALEGGTDRGAGTYITALFNDGDSSWTAFFVVRRYFVVIIVSAVSSWSALLVVLLLVNIGWTALREWRRPVASNTAVLCDRILTGADTLIVICIAVIAGAGVSNPDVSNKQVVNAPVLDTMGTFGLLTLVAAIGAVCFYIGYEVVMTHQARMRGALELGDSDSHLEEGTYKAPDESEVVGGDGDAADGGEASGGAGAGSSGPSTPPAGGAAEKGGETKKSEEKKKKDKGTGEKKKKKKKKKPAEGSDAVAGTPEGKDAEDPAGPAGGAAGGAAAAPAEAGVAAAGAGGKAADGAAAADAEAAPEKKKKKKKKKRDKRASKSGGDDAAAALRGMLK